MLIIVLIVGIFYIATASVAYSGGLYEKYQEKNNVEIENKEQINAQLIGYFLDQNEMPSAFEAKEAVHMQDVKRLLQNFTLLFWILFFVGVYFFSSLKELIDTGFKAGIIVLVILLVLVLFPFEQLFIQFHNIFFASGTWVFSEGIMINLYPRDFFLDMFYVIVYRVVGMALLLIGCKIVTTKKFI